MALNDIYNTLLTQYASSPWLLDCRYTSFLRSIAPHFRHSTLIMALVPYPLIPVISILASVLNILTIATVFRQTWNIGLHLLTTWLFVNNFLVGVESIAWHGASGIKTPVWCDICALNSAYTSYARFSSRQYQQRAVSEL